jgi:hypothetical protein
MSQGRAGALLFIVYLAVNSIAAHAIGAFEQVSPGIFRGPELKTDEDYERLYDHGIKTILTLSNSSRKAWLELKMVRGKHIRVIHAPMSAPGGIFFEPNSAVIHQALKVLDNHKYWPIYVHCWHGEDRTGLLIALHRVFNEGWEPARAYAEMLDKGFHRIFFGLTRFYWRISKRAKRCNELLTR